MHVITQGWTGVDRVHDVTPEIPWMRSGEAYAPDAGDFPDGSQQFRKSLFSIRIAIRIYVLPEELNLAVTEVRHLAGFGEYRVRSPAALFATGERDNAVGAEFIATFNDRDVSAVRIAAGSKFRLKALVGLAIVEAGDANQVPRCASQVAGPRIRQKSAPCTLQLRQHVGQFSIRGGATDQRDVRRALENFFAFLLSHAAQDSEFLALRQQVFKVGEPVEDFLLCLIAN